MTEKMPKGTDGAGFVSALSFLPAPAPCEGSRKSLANLIPEEGSWKRMLHEDDQKPIVSAFQSSV